MILFFRKAMFLENTLLAAYLYQLWSFLRAPVIPTKFWTGKEERLAVSRYKSYLKFLFHTYYLRRQF